ncbi:MULTISPECIES: amidohydrolase family protein [unclassified Roseitalea]|uniref:amidohydrolase family protein n=1 Tax=unclassified Roseitalea TaxID=2639107 RepID=UPI00273DDCB9|nr:MULTISPECIES: amidohydrolase family protein [unclassified Roseitalea]
MTISLLDTHQHLIYPDRFGYDWAAGIDVLAGKAFTIEDYETLTEGLGVAATLFMEVDVDGDQRFAESDFIAELSRDPANRLIGQIAAIRPERDEGFDAELERADALGIVGFRRVLHVVDDAMSQSDTFRDNIRKIGAANKVYDICVAARQLPIALDLARACDNTTLVIDHCGVPDIAGGALDPWRGDMANLAALPHVNCKLSGILAYTAPGSGSYETVRPWVDHVLEVFGPDRIVWGSDWPVVDMGADLPTWIAVTRRILGGLSDSEATAIANASAQRIYGVSLPAA